MEVLGQIAGGVAHDLNNILGALSGYSELLLMEIPEGHKARNRAEKILQSTEKGSAIIQDLLTMTRRGVTSSSVVNLNNIVLDFLKTPVFEKMKEDYPRVAFRAQFQEDLLHIKGSRVHLEKVLMNLFSNAAESISGNGTVTICTENRYLDKPIKGYDEIKEGDYSVLTVSGGEEAVEYLKDHKADILVLDMIMAPGIDGLDAYRRILEIRPKQKAILVSGFSETDRLKKAQQLGAGAYVKKPYVMEKIGIAIRDELAR